MEVLPAVTVLRFACVCARNGALILCLFALNAQPPQSRNKPPSFKSDTQEFPLRSDIQSRSPESNCGAGTWQRVQADALPPLQEPTGHWLQVADMCQQGERTSTRISRNAKTYPESIREGRL